MTSKFVGTKKGTLLVLESLWKKTKGGNSRQYFQVRCDCGKEYEVGQEQFRTSDEPMCIACRREANRKKSSIGVGHPLYPIWRGMLSRCYDQTNEAYGNYGGRGIFVADCWRGKRAKGEFGTMEGFYAFCSAIGERPSEAHSVGRVDNDGGYEPENCRWETQEQQMNNTRANVRITVHGVTKTVTQWGRCLNLPANWYPQCLANKLEPTDFLDSVLLDGAGRCKWVPEADRFVNRVRKTPKLTKRSEQEFLRHLKSL